MRKRRRRPWRSIRRALLIALVPVLLVLFALSMPVLLPLVGLAQARYERRKRLAAARTPCGWCGAPLGAEALARADALFAAYVAKLFPPDRLVKYRIVRDLHACCLRCDAGHRFDEEANRFVLLPGRDFAARYGGLIADAKQSYAAGKASAHCTPSG